MSKSAVPFEESDQEGDYVPDDRLTIRINNVEHLVDSIVQVRRTKVSGAHFRLAMCCLCCKG